MCKNVARDSDRCHNIGIVSWIALLFKNNLKISATLSQETMFGIEFNMVYRLVTVNSFLLRAGTDTLPTPLNLKRWRLKVDSKCHLCGSSAPTVFHYTEWVSCSPKPI